MRKKPLISIIITYYKKKNFIKKTLISIKKQTYKNIEIIFIYDDPKKDDLNFIKKLIKNFNNLNLIINRKNLGVSKSRNIGIKKSKGKYLSFLDADDVWKSKKLEIQINEMLKKNSQISYTSYYVINENDKVINKRNISKKISYNKLSKNCEIGLSTVVAKRSVFNISKFQPLKTQEDFALWLKLMRSGVNFHPINKPLSFWRKTNNSLSSNKIQKLFDAFKLFYRFENKNFLNSIFSVIILSLNKLYKSKYD